MPELPEVETIVRDLRAGGLAGCTIAAARASWPRSIATHTPEAFAKALRHQKIEGVRRRAKFIVLDLSGNSRLLIHLRMSGRLHLENGGRKAPAHEHVTLRLTDGRSLRFRDPRKFGRWYLGQGALEKLAQLGPEPLEKSFNAETFYRCLKTKKRQLKPLLLDQSFLAGLGNIYTDEALWQARLHPVNLSNRLSRVQAGRLYEAIVSVLKTGIRNCGTTLGKSDMNYYSIGGRRGRNQDALKVFRRHGEACPRCGRPIQRLIIAQRSSHVCLRCQPVKRQER